MDDCSHFAKDVRRHNLQTLILHIMRLFVLMLILENHPAVGRDVERNYCLYYHHIHKEVDLAEQGI